MKAHRIRRDGVRARDLAGRILSRDVPGPDGGRAFAKGQVLHDGDVPALLALPWDELHLVEPEPGEVQEEEAGRRIARAVAGEGTVVGAIAGGHWPITAARRGLLRVDAARLERVNGEDGVCAYTLYDGQIVERGEVVARAKISPFAIAASRIEAVEQIAREAPPLRVCAFRPATVAAVVQETLGERAMLRFRAVLAEKVAWFGAALREPTFVPATGDDVAAAVREVVAAGAEIVVMAGTRALDPLDATFVALEELGAPLERFGVPAHPGSLFWMAWLGDVPVLGMPSCGLFSQATVFDLVLPRLLAGERVGRAELIALGNGGLLSREYAFRFPRYREGAGRGELD